MHWAQQNLVCTSSGPTSRQIDAWISKIVHEYGKLSPANVSCILTKTFKTVGHIFPLVGGKNKGHCLKCTCTVKIHKIHWNSPVLALDMGQNHSQSYSKQSPHLSPKILFLAPRQLEWYNWLKERFQSDGQKTNGAKQWVSRKELVVWQIYGLAVCHWIKYLSCFILSGHIFLKIFRLPDN